MSNSLNDGLNKPDQVETGGIDSLEIGSGAVLGPNISGGVVATAHLADAAVTAAKIGAAAVTAAKAAVLGAGSPTGYGLSVQAGSAATNTGSLANVSFGTAFAAAPKAVICTPHGTADRVITVVAGSISTTGFTAISHGGASQEFSWWAIGSGNI